MNFDISISVNTVTTMFLLIVVGYTARKFNIVDESLSKKLSNLILCIAMPFLMLSALLGVDFSKENLFTGLGMIVVSGVLHLISAGISFICSRPLKTVKERQIFQYSAIFENSAFYGFPVLHAIFGPKGVFWGSFYVITFNILTWTYGMFLLSKANKDIKMSPKKMFVNYGTIPCLIGLVLYISQIKLPTPVINTMDYLGGLSTPISMLIIGGVLAGIPIKRLFTNIKAYWLTFTKLILLPIIIGGVALICRLPSDIACFCAVMAGMPTAATTTVFAERYDIEPEFAALCVGITTLCSVATIPLITLIFNHL